ncbi:MAG TPA: DUF4147 domain-containing protein [Blastocatellia bacterium]|nr:DUF4147 domain-containing protein [Blastocatellia bacterium]
MNDAATCAVSIFLKTLAVLDPGALLKQSVSVRGDRLWIGNQELLLGRFDEILIIGFGKAALTMGRGLEEVLEEGLGDHLRWKRDGARKGQGEASPDREWELGIRGLLVVDRGAASGLRCDVIVAGHPVPDGNSLIAGRRIVELVKEAGESSLIIFLISGGGSSLVEVPICPEISLDDLRRLNRLLVGCGATIREINVIRKHLSCLKGGRLGATAGKATGVAICVSDVNAGDIRSLASNPLLPDDATLAEFYEIVRRFGLQKALPDSISALIESGGVAPLEAGNDRVSMLELSNNELALRSAAEVASNMGFLVQVADDLVEGDYKSIAAGMIERFTELVKLNPATPLCLISGGEVSCPVHGDGAGGRNQEFVLYSAVKLAEVLPGHPVCILSSGTDGIDGNSPAAGAVAPPGLIESAYRLGVDPRVFLDRNDSFSFFRKIGGNIITGSTGNNVRDIRLLLSIP